MRKWAPCGSEDRSGWPDVEGAAAVTKSEAAPWLAAMSARSAHLLELIDGEDAVTDHLALGASDRGEHEARAIAQHERRRVGHEQRLEVLRLALRTRMRTHAERNAAHNVANSDAPRRRGRGHTCGRRGIAAAVPAQDAGRYAFCFWRFAKSGIIFL